MHRLIFLAGVPATGKTSLGNWLRDVQGFLHIDAENDNGIDFDNAGVHAEWDQVWETGRADMFVEAINALATPVVVSWGFPVEYLYVVQALKTAGMETWWIHGDPRLARAAYVARYLRHQGPHPGNFGPQIKQIERQWLLIESVFAPHVITGLRPDGSQRPPAEMWAEMASV